MILKEAYFGKTNNLIKAEKYIEKIQNFMNDNKSGNPNNIKEMEKLRELIAKEFNFEEFKLYVQANENEINAATITFFDNENYTDDFFKIDKSSNGIKYSNSNGKVIYTYVTSKLMRYRTPGEIMSIILHEIGHNFYLVDEQIKDFKIKVAVSDILSIISNFTFTNDLNSLIKGLLDVGRYLNHPTKYLEKQLDTTVNNEAFEKQVEDIDKGFIYKTINTISKAISNVLKIIPNITLILLYPLILFTKGKVLEDVVQGSDSYNAERFADQFSASYGYGYEFSELFSGKDMDNRDDFIKNIPIVRTLYYFNESVKDLIIFYNDPHPDSQRRVINTKKKLEYELKNNKDLSKSHIDQLEKDLEKIDNVIKGAPLYKRAIDSIFKFAYDTKDKIGSNKTKLEELFNFDNTILERFIND